MTTQISNCICPECGNSFPIPRRPDRKRARGHRKKLWCPYCGKETNMIEEREGDYMYWPMAEVLEPDGTIRKQATYDAADSMVDALNQLCIWIDHYKFNVIHHWIEDSRHNVVYEERREGS